MIFANVIQDAFGPLITIFEQVLTGIHGVAGSWGLSIIGLTLLIRVLMLPLTIKQFEGMAKLAQHGPELKAIQQRYKDDKQRQQEETMKFYKENNVNPLASCLPLVLQFPVLISLFYMLKLNLKKDICGPALKAIGYTTNTEIQSKTCGQVARIAASKGFTGDAHLATHAAKFLFIPDITAGASGWRLIVLIVFYIGSQLVSSLLTSVNADRNQRMLALGLPFLFTIFIIRFPAGLVVYWITTNFATIAQQFVVRRRVGAPAPKVSVGAVAAMAGSDGGAVEAGAALAGSTPPPPPRKKKKRSGRRR